MLILVAVGLPQPAQAAPAGCHATYLAGYWEYQFVPAAQDRWDQWSDQTQGVCYMAQGSAPLCAPGDTGSGCCQFTEPPVPSGDHPRNALCWHGVKDVPTRTLNPPAGCLPANMRGYPEYQFAKAIWDAYSASTLGVCYFSSTDVSQCSFAYYFANPGAGVRGLCWWPNAAATTFVSLFGPAHFEDLTRDAMAISQVKDALSGGRTVVEYRVGDQVVRVIVEGGQTQGAVPKTPPSGCTAITLTALPEYPSRRADWDAWTAKTDGSCILARPPMKYECTFMEAPASIRSSGGQALCWWGGAGETLKISAAIALPGPVEYTVRMSPDILRTLLNSANVGSTASQLLVDGYISIQASSFAGKLALKALFSGLLDGKLGATPVQIGDVVAYEGGTATVQAGPGKLMIGSFPGALVYYNEFGAAISAFDETAPEKAQKLGALAESAFASLPLGSLGPGEPFFRDVTSTAALSTPGFDDLRYTWDPIPFVAPPIAEPLRDLVSGTDSDVLLGHPIEWYLGDDDPLGDEDPGLMQAFSAIGGLATDPTDATNHAFAWPLNPDAEKTSLYKLGANAGSYPVVDPASTLAFQGYVYVGGP